MSGPTLQQLEELLPLACAWVEEQEQIILRTGVPLTEPLLADAKRIGVAHPERVRLLSVPRIPTPTHPTMAAAGDAIGVMAPQATGLAMRYGIFIRAAGWGRRELVVHELVHVMQYERFGSIERFLAEYLHQCITVGYPAAPLDQEAMRITREVCG